MKHLSWITLTSTVIWLTGCASTPKISVLTPLGPAPNEHADPGNKGFLQVYSARQRAVVDPNAEEFFWNNDFGRNDFLWQSAHTDYRIYTSDGALFKRVRNAQGMNDATPALVELPAGSYKIEALAEDHDGVTFDALVPVVIELGHTTQAHLDRSWEPATKDKNSQLVWLPNGRIAGWRAAGAADTVFVPKNRAD